jgi:hypothetical protein
MLLKDLESEPVAQSHGRVPVGNHSLLPDGLRLRDRLDPLDRENPFVFAVGIDVGTVQVRNLCELGLGEVLRFSSDRADAHVAKRGNVDPDAGVLTH